MSTNENPITPAVLREFAEEMGDTSKLDVAAETLLHACAFQWQALIDHGAEEWGRQFEALAQPAAPAHPQPVALPDVEKVLGEMRESLTPPAYDRVALSLRRCTRTVGREEIAQIAMDALQGRPGFDVRFMREGETRRDAAFKIADRVLSLLAQPAQEKPGFVVDRYSVIGKVVQAAPHLGSGDSVRCTDAAIAEIDRQRAEFEKGGAA